MKECKLEIFEYDAENSGYIDARGFRYSNTDIWYWQDDKRLNGSELMAEYHRMAHEFDIAKYGLEHDPYVGRVTDVEDAGERAEILLRFATSDHEEFDED